jgi:putative hydrolase of the HAD superfamily
MDRIVVFDLDDTLYKELDYLESAYREIADRVRGYGATGDVYNRMISWYKDKRNVFECLNNEYGLDIPLSTYLDWYRNHVPTIALTDGARALLERIKEEGDRAGLISDGRSVTQRHKIVALGLDAYIAPEDIIISEEFGSEKPSERNYRYFMDRYPNRQYFYLGDNPKKDFVTPNRLGWMTIGLHDNGRNVHSQDVDVPDEFQPKEWVWKLI